MRRRRVCRMPKNFELQQSAEAINTRQKRNFGKHTFVKPTRDLVQAASTAYGLSSSQLLSTASK